MQMKDKRISAFPNGDISPLAKYWTTKGANE